jgi:hypothetical protein
MKQAIHFIVLLFLLMSGSTSFSAETPRSASRPKGLNLYVAAGPNFVFPSSIRAGWNDWEGGMLSPGFIGINRVFFLNSGIYAALGLGVNSDAYPTNVGFQGSFGFRWNFLWKLGIRGEMLAKTNFNGNAIVHGLLGVSYGW